MEQYRTLGGLSTTEISPNYGGWKSKMRAPLLLRSNKGFLPACYLPASVFSHGGEHRDTAGSPAPS